jgi:hypothetical protein
MKNFKHPALIWGIAGILLSLLTIIAAVTGIHSNPVLLMDTDVIVQAAEQTLDCVKTGNYEALETMLYGTPALGQLPEKDEATQSRILYTYLDSIRYELADTCQVSGNGISLSVQIQCMDISSVSAALQEIVPDLMQQVADEYGDEARIYDADHNYQNAFLEDVLSRALDQVLADNPHTTQKDLILQFARSQDGWKVVADPTFVQLLTGFISE